VRKLNEQDRQAIVRLMLLGHWSGDDVEQLRGTDAYEKGVKFHTNKLIEALEKKYNNDTVGIFCNDDNNTTSMRYMEALDTFIERIGGLEMADFILYAESLTKVIKEE